MGKLPGIQFSIVWLDLKEINQQIEETLGDITQELSIGMIGMGLGPIEETDPEDDSEEESAWDMISFVFTEEGYDGDGSTDGESCPEPQPISNVDEVEHDSVPELQSVFDTDESMVSKVLDDNLLVTGEESDSSEDNEGIVMSLPNDFSLNVHEFEVLNREVRLEILWKEKLA
ncbi:hypothetical protein C0993_008935 [Termitomyces sp. T159_Od127]|nr:hypothetical protein C0993_008935 [Termitomyces sp. T159_Od127]